MANLAEVACVLLFTLAKCVPLSPFQSQVINDGGAAVPNASIAVSATDAPTTLASLFEADGTPKPNPFNADAQGRYRFYAASGSYNIGITGPGVSTTLVNVAVVDARQAHSSAGSNTQAPVTLVESSSVTAAGNAALVLERRRADGTLLYAPWSLHLNKGPGGRRTDLRWLYNTDWNEARQSTTDLLTADAAFAMTLAPRGASAGAGESQPFAFSFEYAAADPAGARPDWIDVFRQDETVLRGVGVLGVARIGTGPFVVGDGLINSSLVARRVGWNTYRTTAPAGVLTPIANPEVPPQPGDVVAPVAAPRGDAMAAPTSQHAQLHASVYLRRGNGTSASLLAVGKALVRIASGVTAAPGDVIVSSGSESGRATVDNSVTDPRRIVGFALEPVGRTLPGHVAILRSSR